MQHNLTNNDKSSEQHKREAPSSYSDDFGLMQAIYKQDENAIKGLIKYYDHEVNSQIWAGGYRGSQYEKHSTPLSYAIACGNIKIIKLLISLGADTTNYFALLAAENSNSDEINKLFFPRVESVPANVGSTKEDLGKQLEQAFHEKAKPEVLHALVAKGAPVDYRLDYGLEIRLESDFVAEFFFLLQGDLGKQKLLEHTKQLLTVEKDAVGLANYVSTAMDFFTTLHAYDKELKSNTSPVSEEFKNFLKENAVLARANPFHKNGALIIAAGLRDPKLVQEIIQKGAMSKVDPQFNGAHIEFKGFFDDTAAVWSAILLDKATLEVLLNHGVKVNDCVGITKSTLLHWVTVAARIDISEERQEAAYNIAQMLLKKGAKPNIQNKLNLCPMDYARGKLKTLFSVHLQQEAKVTDLFNPQKNPAQKETYLGAQPGFIKGKR